MPETLNHQTGESQKGNMKRSIEQYTAQELESALNFALCGIDRVTSTMARKVQSGELDLTKAMQYCRLSFEPLNYSQGEEYAKSR